MKAKQTKEISINMSEQEARIIKDFLYWLDFPTIPIGFDFPLMDLYETLYVTLDHKDPIPLYDLVLSRREN